MTKSQSFTIESYKINLQQNMSANVRTISLLSPDLAHGIRIRATVLFTAQNPFKSAINALGQVNNLGGTNFDPIDLVLWCDPALFDGFYQVLCNEKPLSLQFWYEEDPSSTTKEISLFELKTETEFPGDYEKALSLVMPKVLETAK